MRGKIEIIFIRDGKNVDIVAYKFMDYVNIYLCPFDNFTKFPFIVCFFQKILKKIVKLC